MARSFRAAPLLPALAVHLMLTVSAQAADFQVFKNGACQAAKDCNIDFQVVPAARTLTINRFSCYLRMKYTEVAYFSQLELVSSSGGIPLFEVSRLSQLPLVQTGSTGVQRVYTSNDAVLAVAAAGQHFRAHAQALNSSTGKLSTIQQYSCQVSGTLN